MLSHILFSSSVAVVTIFQIYQLSRRSTGQYGDEVKMEVSRFISVDKAKEIKEEYGTPIYIYDERTLIDQANKALLFPNLYGLKVRFAMKACPNAAILKLFMKMGICFDASSGYEVRRAVMAGVNPQDISLSSQELPHDFQELIELGIEFNACSLKQLETFGQLFPKRGCGVRFNPGKGSGGTGKTVSIFFASIAVK